MAQDFLNKYIRRIRFQLRDVKGRNKLIEDENGELTVESTDEEIESAIDFVLDNSEVQPPIVIKMDLAQWSKHAFFTYGVISYLLDSVAIMNIRNTMPISDGGISIDDTYKAGPYANQALALWDKYEKGLERFKIHYNLMSYSWDGTAYYDYWGPAGYRCW